MATTRRKNRSDLTTRNLHHQQKTDFQQDYRLQRLVRVVDGLKVTRVKHEARLHALEMAVLLCLQRTMPTSKVPSKRNARASRKRR